MVARPPLRPYPPEGKTPMCRKCSRAGQAPKLVGKDRAVVPARCPTQACRYGSCCSKTCLCKNQCSFDFWPEFNSDQIDICSVIYCSTSHQPFRNTAGAATRLAPLKKGD